MDDRDIMQAFVTGGARRGFGSTLHIEGDCLFLDGWWQAAFRVSAQAFSIRNEDPPTESSVLTDMASELTKLGLEPIGVNPSLLYAVTYAEIALGLVAWTYWATDAATGETALALRAGHDEFLTDVVPGTSGIRDADYSAELGGARRNAGLPPSVVLAVGLADNEADTLRTLLTDCRVEARALGSIQPEACGSMIPTLVLVNAEARAGEEFAMELRAAACGRYVPVLTLTPDGTPVLGADAGARAGSPPGTWVDQIRNLLP